jgi:hypothetical protein
MSSERTLVSMFFAAFRLSSAEFAGEMQVLLLAAAGMPQRSFCFCSRFVAIAHGLLGAENRKGLPFAVASYLRYKCSPVGIERAHNMVTQFRNYGAGLIFQRRDFFGGSILEVNCD